MSRLGLFLNRVGRRRRKKIDGMLDIGNHDGGRVKVKLLHSAVGADGEERGSRSVHSQAFYMLQGWDRIKGDVLCPDVPRERLPNAW
jgi:hypothetical protein